eukprot:scaffold34595_cov160-Amphora_coffeaeformis.AAC.18
MASVQMVRTHHYLMDDTRRSKHGAQRIRFQSRRTRSAWTRPREFPKWRIVQYNTTLIWYQYGTMVADGTRISRRRLHIRTPNVIVSPSIGAECHLNRRENQ